MEKQGESLTKIEPDNNGKNTPAAPRKQEGNKPAKRHRNRPDLAKFGEEHTAPGDNARYLRLARVGIQLPPIDISDPKQVEDRINQYFDFCEENDLKPNIKSLGNWLGVDDTTVHSWRRGEYRAETHSQVIKKAVDVIQALWWAYGQDGKVNPASWIFIGKNAFGMRDVQEITVEPRQPLAGGLSSEEIARKYNALPDSGTTAGEIDGNGAYLADMPGNCSSN